MIILIGESGSGKTTLLNEISKRGYEKAINYTTRTKRQEETESEYRHITKEQFETLWEQGKLLQRAEFNGEYYGISIESLKENTVCIQIVSSISDIRKRAIEMGKTDIRQTVFYVHVPAEERTKRMLKRGDSLEAIQKRLSIDKEKFKHAEQVADFTIENENLNETINQILQLYEQKS